MRWTCCGCCCCRCASCCRTACCTPCGARRRRCQKAVASLLRFRRGCSSCCFLLLLLLLDFLAHLDDQRLPDTAAVIYKPVADLRQSMFDTMLAPGLRLLYSIVGSNKVPGRLAFKDSNRQLIWHLQYAIMHVLRSGCSQPYTCARGRPVRRLSMSFSSGCGNGRSKNASTHSAYKDSTANLRRAAWLQLHNTPAYPPAACLMPGQLLPVCSELRLSAMHLQLFL